MDGRSASLLVPRLLIASMFEPVWFAEKTVAEGAAGVLALVAVAASRGSSQE